MPLACLQESIKPSEAQDERFMKAVYSEKMLARKQEGHWEHVATMDIELPSAITRGHSYNEAQLWTIRFARDTSSDLGQTQLNQQGAKA